MTVLSSSQDNEKIYSFVFPSCFILDWDPLTSVPAPSFLQCTLLSVSKFTLSSLSLEATLSCQDSSSSRRGSYFFCSQSCLLEEDSNDVPEGCTGGLWNFSFPAHSNLLSTLYFPTLWCRGLNPEPHACWASAPPLNHTPSSEGFILQRTWVFSASFSLFLGGD